MAATDLITLEDARAFLQKQVGQTATDDVLADLVTRASGMIGRYCDVRFLPVETSTSRLFLWDGGSVISLAPFVAQSVTSVILDYGEASQFDVSGGFRGGPEPQTDGVYYFVELDFRFIPAYTGAFSSRRARVTGTFGYPDVPVEVQQACCVTVADWYRGRVAAFNTAFQDAGEQSAPRGPEALPQAAWRLLEPFKRPVM